MTTTSDRTAADAAASFRRAMRLRETDPLAHQLALHQHFDRFVPPLGWLRSCPLPSR